MKFKSTIFFAPILFVIQFGCDRENREELANKYLASQIDSVSNHLLSFTSFKKIDGIEKQKESMTYELTFKGFVSAVDDCYWDGYINSSTAASSLAEGLYGSNYGMERKGLLGMNISISQEDLTRKEHVTGQYNLYKKGDGHFVKGYIIFEKRDSGWQILEMDMKHDNEAAILFEKNRNPAIKSQKPDTVKKANMIPSVQYSGVFSYLSEKSSYGHVSIYPESDTILLFYLDLNHGAPSYNMGALYGRVKILNGNGIYYSKYSDYEIGCKLRFIFNQNSLTIKTIEPDTDCNFGNGVSADGVFYKKSSKIPVHFEDMEGTKVYFKDTKPEDYNN